MRPAFQITPNLPGFVKKFRKQTKTQLLISERCTMAKLRKKRENKVGAWVDLKGYVEEGNGVLRWPAARGTGRLLLVGFLTLDPAQDAAFAAGVTLAAHSDRSPLRAHNIETDAAPVPSKQKDPIHHHMCCGRHGEGGQPVKGVAHKNRPVSTFLCN